VAGAVSGKGALVEEGQLQQAEASNRKAAVAEEAVADAKREEATQDKGEADCWDDERATRILRNRRAAARPGSRLLVVEGIVPDDTTPSVAKIMDLEMLCLTSGRERTMSELRTLLVAAHNEVTIPDNRSDNTANYVEAEAL
jgi:O-methyltransferase domain